MKTITLSDETYAALITALSVPQDPLPTPTPEPVPAKSSGIFVPWKVRVGTFSTTIDPGEIVSFEFTPEVTNGKLASFVISPADGSAYIATEMSLSSIPAGFGDRTVLGQGGRLYFSAGGYPMDKYNRVDARYPDLTPGVNWFVNVRLKDPTATAKINYALMPA